MGVEVRPFGVRCNIACSYCYQQPEREAGNVVEHYELERIFAALDENGTEFTLFGGEPLLMPLRDLEQLFRFGLERFGQNAVQTNGTLVNDRHIELFRRYQVTVGVSCDGPGRCNELRVAGDARATARATERTLATIDRLLDEGIGLGLIVTLHRANAVEDRLEELRSWFTDLDRGGLQSARLHLLEVDDELVGAAHALTAEENIAALIRLLDDAGRYEHLKFDVAGELGRLLAGRDRGVTCVWQACDPYTTRAVQGLEGTGQLSNCGRTNKAGIDFVKADHAGYERYLALYHTPQRDGGCRGCRFFLQCKGHCPGTALGGDWRSRTEHCEVWKHLFGMEEAAMTARGEVPVSRLPQRAVVERAMLATWAQGRTVHVAGAMEWLRGHGFDPAAEHPASPPPASVAALAPLDLDHDPETFHTNDGMRLVTDWEPPEWSRLSWISDGARAVWEPRFWSVRDTMQHLEWRSVAAGLRRAAVVVVVHDELPELEAAVTEHGLVVTPLETITTRTPELTQARWRGGDVISLIQVAVASPGDAEDFAAAIVADDHTAVSALLGTPDCCAKFLHDEWVGNRRSDVTWAAAVRSVRAGHGGAVGPNEVEVEERPATNLMWRALGLRPVFHLPCAANCAETERVAAEVDALGRHLGFGTEMSWLDEILRWPVAWSAFHGIAEILTPVGRISTNTDPTLDRHVVRRRSDRVPAEMLPGLAFPYDRSRAPSVPVTLGPRRR